MNIIAKHTLKNSDKLTNQEIISIILSNRKINNITEFLTPTSPLITQISDFGFKREIQKTIKMLEEIHITKKMIIVYTDYDADGITGGAILWETLHILGFNVMPYVPHRRLEGYGFSIKGIDAIKKKYNPGLIISVDHGITAKDKIAYAKKIGIPVIVTDHHLKPKILPYAAAIFHIPELSGAGVSYFFAKMVFDYFKNKTNPGNVTQLSKHFSVDYLCLAAIGAVADLVPLVKVNRSIVKYGLDAFSKIKRVGIVHILKDAGIYNRKITPYEIGFMIAPRINAVGRLEHALVALRLLCTNKDDTAKKIAAGIGDTNRERQDLVVLAIKDAELQINKKYGKNIPKLLILHSSVWHEGIIGLIASKIAETYFRPTIVMTKNDGTYKGSARSIPGFHMTEYLRGLTKLLIDVGGHAQAAGFTIDEKKISEFIKSAGKKADKIITSKILEKKYYADLHIPLSKIKISLASELEKLAPFGIGNPEPVFTSRALLLDAKIFGKKNEHLKIYVKDPVNNSYPLELIYFFHADQYSKLARNQLINIAYKLSIDRWSGKEKLRGIITAMQGSS